MKNRKRVNNRANLYGNVNVAGEPVYGPRYCSCGVGQCIGKPGVRCLVSGFVVEEPRPKVHGTGSIE